MKSRLSVEKASKRKICSGFTGSFGRAMHFELSFLKLGGRVSLHWNTSPKINP